jgi:transcriptional regulator with XRE-family HTH domain
MNSHKICNMEIEKQDHKMLKNIRLGARIRAARKAAGFKTSKQFTKNHKIPESTYSQHESGARYPNDEMLQFYCKIFEVNLNWLKTGNGNPYTQKNSRKNSIISDELIDLKKPNIKNKIDQKLLERILIDLLREFDLNKIAKKAAEIYIEYSKKV